MSTKRSKAKAGVSHRLAAHLRAEPFRLADENPTATRALGRSQTNNEWLIFHSRDVAREPGSSGNSWTMMDRALEGAVERKNRGFGHGGGVAMGARLNAFFAISVNSPSVRMVNFSCCVCSALKPGAFGVTRRVAPQPMRAAVRMEAGAHACL
jgi:hypothetical protein